MPNAVAQRARSRNARPIAAVLVIGALTAMVMQYRSATNFPTDDPVEIVDEALIATLRAAPGLHRALARNFRFAPGVEATLGLKDDALNRRVYGTQLDRREMGRRNAAIHIQQKDGRGAIHADGTNPKHGVLAWLVHATLDVPFTPLCAILMIGVVLLYRTRRPRRKP